MRRRGTEQEGSQGPGHTDDHRPGEEVDAVAGPQHLRDPHAQAQEPTQHPGECAPGNAGLMIPP